MSDHRFTFMGTAAGCGVPSFFCSCPACEEARANPTLRRGDCGVMVRGERTLVIDTPPDARHQLLREDVRSVDQILFSHGHYDHIGGLGEYEYMVNLVRAGEPVPVFSTPEARGIIQNEFHYMDRCLAWTDIEPFEPLEFDGVRYTPLPVTHAAGAVGYLIESLGSDGAGGAADGDDASGLDGADGEGKRIFYASDTATLPPETAERIRGIDVLAMDATFWGRNWRPDAHHSIQECIEEALELDVGVLYLTHMCMHYDTPITYAELVDYLKPYRGRVLPALDGLTFAF